jgi:hypothetical protein
MMYQSRTRNFVIRLVHKGSDFASALIPSSNARSEERSDQIRSSPPETTGTREATQALVGTTKCSTAERRGMHGLSLSKELLREIRTNTRDTPTNNSLLSTKTSTQRHVFFDEPSAVSHNSNTVSVVQQPSKPTVTRTQQQRATTSPSPPALPPRPASCRAAPQTTRTSLFDAEMLRAVQLKPSASRTQQQRNSRRETLGGNTGPSTMTQALQRALDEKFKSLR